MRGVTFWRTDRLAQVRTTTRKAGDLLGTAFIGRLGTAGVDTSGAVGMHNLRSNTIWSTHHLSSVTTNIGKARNSTSSTTAGARAILEAVAHFLAGLRRACGAGRT